jgi:hypothetical protein
MRNVWFVAILAVAVIAVGCGVGGGGAEGAAKDILEGVKKGDSSVLLDYLDLKGMYEQQVPEEAREQMTFEQFEQQMRDALGKEKEAPEGFEYEILGSEVKDDVTLVKVKVKEDKDADWEQHEVPFRKIDGKWKVKFEDLLQLGQE